MTTIEWTDATWNPVTGCDQVSPGCDNRYALTAVLTLDQLVALIREATTPEEGVA